MLSTKQRNRMIRRAIKAARKDGYDAGALYSHEGTYLGNLYPRQGFVTFNFHHLEWAVRVDFEVSP